MENITTLMLIPYAAQNLQVKTMLKMLEKERGVRFKREELLEIAKAYSEIKKTVRSKMAKEIFNDIRRSKESSSS